jgi:hypothetical protein
LIVRVKHVVPSDWFWGGISNGGNVNPKFQVCIY